MDVVSELENREMTVVMGPHGFETGLTTKLAGRNSEFEALKQCLLDESDKVGRRREGCRSCQPGRRCKGGRRSKRAYASNNPEGVWRRRETKARTDARGAHESVLQLCRRLRNGRLSLQVRQLQWIAKDGV